MTQLRDDLVALLTEDDDEYDIPGDGWLYRPNPDVAELCIDALADRLVLFINHLREGL